MYMGTPGHSVLGCLLSHLSSNDDLSGSCFNSGYKKMAILKNLFDEMGSMSVEPTSFSNFFLTQCHLGIKDVGNFLTFLNDKGEVRFCTPGFFLHFIYFGRKMFPTCDLTVT